MPGSVSYDFGGRVALVTGATGGVGPAVVRAFASAGATVIGLTHRARPANVDLLRAGLDPDAAARVSQLEADVLDEASVEHAVQQALAQFGAIHVVVNTVGGFSGGRAITETDLETWQRMMDLNARTAFLMAKHVVPPMVSQGFGRLIHFSSRAAFDDARKAAAYGSAKRAVIALTEAQAAEVREAGVTVNAVVPSIIDTPTNRRDMPNAHFERWPTPDAIARVVLFLASDDAGLISGAAIPVYGLG